jgi:hypothetical protein
MEILMKNHKLWSYITDDAAELKLVNPDYVTIAETQAHKCWEEEEQYTFFSYSYETK